MKLFKLKTNQNLMTITVSITILLFKDLPLNINFRNKKYKAPTPEITTKII